MNMIFDNNIFQKQIYDKYSQICVINGSNLSPFCPKPKSYEVTLIFGQDMFKTPYNNQAR